MKRPRLRMVCAGEARFVATLPHPDRLTMVQL